MAPPHTHTHTHSQTHSQTYKLTHNPLPQELLLELKALSGYDLAQPYTTTEEEEALVRATLAWP